jgi:hypothetical protein
MEKYKQIHVYTNAVIAEKEYGDLFRELFKPVAALESLVQYNLNRIVSITGGGGNTNRKYVAAAFRFLELLGDFREPEGEWHILPDDEKKVLINKCINHLEAIYRENDCTKVLVTSDSITFLKEAERLPFVYVIPGEICHIGDTQSLAKDAILKVFLDYFMLTYSQKIYLVVEDRMYQSGFSYRAALHGNVPFTIRRGDSLA